MQELHSHVPVSGLSINRLEEALTLLGFRSDGGDSIVLEQAYCALVAELDVALRTKGRVCSDGETKQLAVLDEGLLREVRV